IEHLRQVRERITPWVSSAAPREFAAARVKSPEASWHAAVIIRRARPEGTVLALSTASLPGRRGIDGATPRRKRRERKRPRPRARRLVMVATGQRSKAATWA